jgi:hypothetical protein
MVNLLGTGVPAVMVPTVEVALAARLLHAAAGRY